jgi:hypothetical protein
MVPNTKNVSILLGRGISDETQVLVQVENGDKQFLKQKCHAIDEKAQHDELKRFSLWVLGGEGGGERRGEEREA